MDAAEAANESTTNIANNDGGDGGNGGSGDGGDGGSGDGGGGGSGGGGDDDGDDERSGGGKGLSVAALGGDGGGKGPVNFANDATRLGHGTSMAAPFVAGAAAIFLSHVRFATANDVHAALIAGASRDKVGDPGEGSPNLLLNVRGVEAQAKKCRRNHAAACSFGEWSAWAPPTCPDPEAPCNGVMTRRAREVVAAPLCGRKLCAQQPEAVEEAQCPCGMAPLLPPPAPPTPAYPSPPAPVKRRPAISNYGTPRVEAFGGSGGLDSLSPPRPIIEGSTVWRSRRLGQPVFQGSF